MPRLCLLDFDHGCYYSAHCSSYPIRYISFRYSLSMRSFVFLVFCLPIRTDESQLNLAWSDTLLSVWKLRQFGWWCCPRCPTLPLMLLAHLPSTTGSWNSRMFYLGGVLMRRCPKDLTAPYPTTRCAKRVIRRDCPRNLRGWVWMTIQRRKIISTVRNGVGPSMPANCDLSLGATLVSLIDRRNQCTKCRRI